MADYIMTGEALADEGLRIAHTVPTIYMYACYGFKVTDATIRNKSAQNLNGWYTQKKIQKLQAVANQQPPVWGFDCVNLIKGILWGWTGDPEKEKGGAKYAANGVPDTNADGMISRCRGVTDDFGQICVGEAVWMKGHIGLYVGDGYAVECTPTWDDGVQVTAVWNIGKKAGYNGRYWTKHGKLPWIDYGEAEETGETEETETPEYGLGARALKRGCLGEDVMELQAVLIRLGFSCGAAGADGDFGSGTQKALIAFQTAAGLTPDGIFGRASLEALKGALERKEDAPEVEARYTITIRGLGAAEMEAMRQRWPECEVTEE